MDTTAANLVCSLPSLAPVKAKGPGKVTHSRLSEVSIQYRRGQPVAGLSGKPIIQTTRTQSSSIICAYAAAGQTQTVTQKSPTLTHIPGKQKGPQLADGGGGFPPRDDSGGGGGGGGGENFSGGFFLFGVLAFLGFLKELDVKDDKRDRRK